jgi:UDP-glucose 4-epimerase
MTSWLVTGGAGYIGAHIVKALADSGETAVVLDDLSTGTAERVGNATLVTGTVLDTDLVTRTLREHDIKGIVHVAAKKQVGESVERPLYYYRENVDGLLSVLDAATAAGVESFVFSSSAAVYGMPTVEKVTEDDGGVPLSPYGQTKLTGEWVSRAVGDATGMRVISLRYFNVAGAGTVELGDPGAFNLIPMVFEALGRGEAPKVFGNDYPTPDGTCIRDYVHVTDIADAHVAALRHLRDGGGSATYNIGRGVGSSVLEVLRTIVEVTGNETPPEVVARRPGDPARTVAVVDRIRDDLGWTASHDLRDMVSSAWEAWQARQPAH